jgi:hypothetical protein
MPSHTTILLQSCLLLLVFKLMFKGISQCIPPVSTLYFSKFNPFHYFLTPLPSAPYFSTAFNTYPYILYLHRCYVLWYCWSSTMLFFFPFPVSPSSIDLLRVVVFLLKINCLDLSSLHSPLQIQRKLIFMSKNKRKISILPGAAPTL